MNKQKGVSLYITLIIMTILLSIVLGLTSIIITGAKIASQFSDAVRAFSAADTGIENALYNFYKNNNCSNFSSNSIQGDSSYSYSVTIVTAGVCPPSTVNSLGNFNSAGSGTTARNIQVYY